MASVYADAIEETWGGDGGRPLVFQGDGGRPLVFQFTSDNTDRNNFLDRLGGIAKESDTSCFGWALIPNHLLLRTMRPNLSKSMQWLGTRYTRRFNLRNLQSGHLFQGRFKSIIVENDAYLLRLSCYIHRNPLREGWFKFKSSEASAFAGGTI